MKKERAVHKWNPIGGPEDGDPNLFQCENCLVVKATKGTKEEFSRPDGEILVKATSRPRNRPRCIE